MSIGGGKVDPAILQQIGFTWLEADLKPRMIVRTDATALWINAGTQRLLEECGAIRIANGVVRLADPLHDASFQNFLKSLVAHSRVMAIKFHGERCFCVFRGRRVADADVCCIEIRFTSARHHPQLVDFDQVFGLTASEARTAAALYSGQSARDVADSQRISIDTVRSHIRQLYAKIGVSGREQLFHQLDPFRLD